MPTSLTVDTARCNDGKLGLIAAGEIDLSNVDAFNQSLTTAVAEAAGQRRTAYCRPQCWGVPGQQRH